MTRQKSFKRLVRARMEKTGESYTAARGMLLGAEVVKGIAKPVLATSDETIRRRTGRGWEEWFDLLDEWGAPDRTHRETARWVAELQEIEPLAWNAQAVVSSYERARGLRAVGEHREGFAVTVSRTIAVPVGRLYEAFVEESVRERWLPGARMRERTAGRASGAPSPRGSVRRVERGLAAGQDSRPALADRFEDGAPRAGAWLPGSSATDPFRTQVERRALRGSGSNGASTSGRLQIPGSRWERAPIRSRQRIHLDEAQRRGCPARGC